MELDKSKWKKGPWTDEPDQDAWKYEDYFCHMKKNQWGAWCGYVSIPKSHPLYGLTYNDALPEKFNFMWEKAKRRELTSDVIDKKIGVFNLFAHHLKKDGEPPEISLILEAHGGITFSDHYQGVTDLKGLWTFGFDCGHAWDLQPAFGNQFLMGDEVYRDQAYVVDNVNALACQLKCFENLQK